MQKNAAQQLPENYDQIFVGATRAAVILKYGAPDRTTRLIKDIRLMEYRSREKTIYKSLPREDEECTLRLWYMDKKGVNDPYIAKTDYLGNKSVCDTFVFLGKKSRTYDMRYR